MKDFLKRELEVGDHVIAIHQWYKSYKLCRIERFTPKKVVLRWNSSGDTRMQDPEQLVKVEGEDLTYFFLQQK